jgi:hypothetical protein
MGTQKVISSTSQMKNKDDSEEKKIKELNAIKNAQSKKQKSQ